MPATRGLVFKKSIAWQFTEIYPAAVCVISFRDVHHHDP
jgi:hypothetical protein